MARFSALSLFFVFGSVCAADEVAGRKLYLEGITPSGEPLSALVGYGQTALSGQAVACGNCHGADGKGRAEGGVLPSQIGWEELTKPYGHAHPGGRKHGAFGESSLLRAVNEGLDPAGNRLDWAMPRYALSRADAEALVAHLKRLGEERAPGVGEATLRIGTVLPQGSRMAAAGAMHEALSAYFEKLNRAGGLHQRRLELVVAGDYREAQERFAAEPVFALLSPVELGRQGELRAFILRTKLPTVGPFTAAPGQLADTQASVFHVLPGPAEEAAVLVDFAARRAGARLRGAIIASGAAADEQAAQAAARRCTARVCGELSRVGWYAARFDAAAAVERLKAEAREQLFFFGADEEFAQLLDAANQAADASWRPVVHAPGALARTALAARERFDGSVFLAFSAVPAGQSLRELRQEFGLQPRHEAAQTAALAAASVLVEGLRRAGRDLTRERLVQALESLNNFDPQGYGPAVSFGPDRHVGVLGGYVVRVEGARGIVPASAWIELD